MAFFKQLLILQFQYISCICETRKYITLFTKIHHWSRLEQVEKHIYKPFAVGRFCL
jgi:hypothetical protein